MDKKIQAAVTLNGKDKTVAFTTTGAEVKEQSVIFKSGFQVWSFSERSVRQQLPVSLRLPKRRGLFFLRLWEFQTALTLTAPPSGSMVTSSADTMFQFPWEYVQLDVSFYSPTTSCHRTPPGLLGPSV